MSFSDSLDRTSLNINWSSYDDSIDLNRVFCYEISVPDEECSTFEIDEVNQQNYFYLRVF